MVYRSGLKCTAVSSLGSVRSRPQADIQRALITSAFEGIADIENSEPARPFLPKADFYEFVSVGS